MKFEFTMLVPVTITSEDIDDIMVAALEGGITHWCRRVEVVGESRATGFPGAAHFGSLILRAATLGY